MTITGPALLATAAAVARLGSTPSAFTGCTSGELDAAAHAIRDLRRCCDSYLAWIAAEIARRSDPSRGEPGLAQTQGHRTPERMVEVLTGVTKSEAVGLVKVGTMLAETEAAETLQREHPELPVAQLDALIPWQAGIAHAVAAGGLPVAKADAIRAGLGEPTTEITGNQLAWAADELIGEARDLTVGQLHRRARQARDDLDEAGIADRERRQQEQQYLKAWKRPDGMVQGAFLYAPEPGAYLLSVLDELTSPRRGGLRFVRKDDEARYDRIANDPRSTDRIAADGFLELLRIGADADPGTVYGVKKPAVRIVVSKETAETGAGHGTIELTGEPVTIGVIEQAICETGTVPVVLDDDGQCINVGREQRLFTNRQRTGLAVRDGGCLWPGCDRPPSWCEAHHINHWHRDTGRTDIADGVLLCKHHHLLLHNHGWDISRVDGRYYLLPPASVDPAQTPRLLTGKGTAVHDWNRRHQRTRDLASDTVHHQYGP